MKVIEEKYKVLQYCKNNHITLMEFSVTDIEARQLSHYFAELGATSRDPISIYKDEQKIYRDTIMGLTILFGIPVKVRGKLRAS